MIYRSVSTFIFALSLIVLVGACQDEQVENPGATLFQKGEGVFITHEGSFGSGHGVLSYYNFARDTMMEGIYEEMNGEVLGSILQGAYFENDEAYLVVNGSGIIVQIDPATGKQVNVISGLPSPNHFIISESDGYGYVSDLFGPFVYRVDMVSGTVSDSLFAGGGTGELHILNNHLFITKTSDFGAPPSSHVFVAERSPFRIIDTIEVGFNPMVIRRDAEGYLWVMCNGNSFENRKGGLYRIDPGTRETSTVIPFPDLDVSYAARMEMNADLNEIYFLKGDVYRISIRDQAFPASPVIESGGSSLYGLGIRPGNGDIYLGVEDFISESRILVYSSSGILISARESRIGTNHFYFY